MHQHICPISKGTVREHKWNHKSLICEVPSESICVIHAIDDTAFTSIASIHSHNCPVGSLVHDWECETTACSLGENSMCPIHSQYEK